MNVIVFICVACIVGLLVGDVIIYAIEGPHVRWTRLAWDNLFVGAVLAIIVTCAVIALGRL